MVYLTATQPPFNERETMRGPFWNPRTGVTGEPKFRTNEPNFVTTTDAEGRTVTLTGDAADAFRATSGRTKA
jgi:hypothetical protein